MSSPVRIIIVSHQHPHLSMGGAQLAAFNLFREFQLRKDCEVIFLAGSEDSSTFHPGSLFTTHNKDELLIYSNVKNRFWLSQTNKRLIAHDFPQLLNSFKPTVIHFQHYRLGPELIRICRQYSNELFIAVTLHELLPICAHGGQMIKTRNNKLCYISRPADCHLCFPEHPPADFFLRERYIKSFFNLVDCFISPSHFLRERYIQWGIPGEKIVVLENGQPPLDPLPPRVIHDNETYGRFAYFGQLKPTKGLEVLLKAVSLIAAEGRNDFHLHIYGDNLEKQPVNFQDEFMTTIERMKDIVTFHSSYEQHELRRLMANIDWVIVPSIWWENSPMVIQEAFNNGRPVICSNIGGMAEKVRDGVDGLHFRVGDTHNLAEIMETVLDNKEIWSKLVENIKSCVSLKTSASEHLLLYKNKLKTHGLLTA